jgi:tetratricopeptide (TPR) repeat protein
MSDKDQWLQKARECRLRDPEQAKKYYARVLEENPGHVQAREELAGLCLGEIMESRARKPGEVNFTKAMEALEDYLRYDRTDRAAEEVYQVLYRLRPAATERIDPYQEAWERLGRLEGSSPVVPVCRELVRLELARLLYLRAVSLKWDRNWEAAIEAAQRAREMDRENIWDLDGLIAKIRREQESGQVPSETPISVPETPPPDFSYEETIAMLERVAQRQGGLESWNAVRWLYEGLARDLIIQGEYQKALNLLNKAIDLRPDDDDEVSRELRKAVLTCLQAEDLFRSGNPQKALDLLRGTDIQDPLLARHIGQKAQQAARLPPLKRIAYYGRLFLDGIQEQWKKRETRILWQIVGFLWVLTIIIWAIWGILWLLNR